MVLRSYVYAKMGNTNIYMDLGWTRECDKLSNQEINWLKLILVQIGALDFD